MKYAEALRQLTEGVVKKFILMGAEDYLKRSFEKAFQSMFQADSVRCFYPGQEEDAVSVMASQPLYGIYGVVLKDVDLMQGKAIIYRVQEYEGPLLAVVSADCSGKNSRIVALTSTCTPVQCAKMSEYGQEYAVWILAQARTMGYEFVDQAEDHLLRQVEPDMSLLSGELYKLWLYKGDNKTVSIADVNAVVSTVVSPSQFSLLDSIIRRDVVESLRVVAAYFRFGSDVVGLVVFLGVYFEKMYRLLLMQEKGMRPDEMAAMVAIPPYLIKTRYLPRATAWGRRRIGDFIDALCRLMTRLGTFQGDQSILVDALILNEIAAQK